MITAIQSHRYFNPDMRKKATENCHRMLKTKGVYITFGNVRPPSDMSIRAGLDRWTRFQIINELPNLEEYKHFRLAVGWKLVDDKSRLKGLNSSTYSILAKVGDKTVGMERIVGDRGIFH